MRYNLDVDDRSLILAFAGCSLDEKPGSNWVQDAGGLPSYICEIARAIKRGGKTTSQAIAIAVSRVKMWATGKGVDAKTQAKATEAVAAWEALRAKSKAKKVVKGAGKAASNGDKKVAATYVDSAVLNLSDYNMDTVRQAFDQRTRKIRDDWRAANPNGDLYGDDAPQRLWVKEVWNTFVIVQSSYGDDPDLYKIPYTVEDEGDVTFGDAVEVQQQYVEVPDDSDDDDKLTDDALKQMMASVGPCHPTAVDKLLQFTADTADTRRAVDLAVASTAKLLTGLSKVLALADDSKPYGDVTYADPGYQGDKKKRYPLDTAAHVRSAWSYINQDDNAKAYSAVQVVAIKGKIRTAAKKFNIEISD